MLPELLTSHHDRHGRLRDEVIAETPKQNAFDLASSTTADDDQCRRKVVDELCDHVPSGSNLDTGTGCVDPVKCCDLYVFSKACWPAARLLGRPSTAATACGRLDQWCRKTHLVGKQRDKIFVSNIVTTFATMKQPSKPYLVSPKVEDVVLDELVKGM